MIMRNHTFSLGLMLTALALTTACRSAESDELELEFRTSFGCPSCNYSGSNSPEHNEYPIHTLGLDGQENADGLTVLGIARVGDPTVYQLAVENDELQVWNGTTIVTVGSGLVGWTILLEDGSEELEVHILDYTNTMASWADGADPISAYALAYVDPDDGRLVNVCPNASPNETAVTILGDTVYEDGPHLFIEELDWATLACMGNAAAKMKLMSYSRYGSFDQAEPATEAQRRATVRMLTADYCGQGVSFTAQGTPLDWQNAVGTVTPEHDPNPSWENVEAIWDENGALCLSAPRLATLAEVEVYCDLPPECDESMLAFPYEWVTWVVPS
jgi:hypothetical protein